MEKLDYMKVRYMGEWWNVKRIGLEEEGKEHDEDILYIADSNGNEIGWIYRKDIEKWIGVIV